MDFPQLNLIEVYILAGIVVIGFGIVGLIAKIRQGDK